MTSRMRYGAQNTRVCILGMHMVVGRWRTLCYSDHVRREAGSLGSILQTIGC
jgi:hypothetical protein